MSSLKEIARSLIRTDLIWTFISYVIWMSNREGDLARKLLHIKHMSAENRINALIGKISPNLEVMYGPFEEMRYPSFSAYGSSFAPKILGIYERELHPFISSPRQYDSIYNIGSAEGYYAVGLVLAKKAPMAYCFDLSELAQQECLKLADCNGVKDRVKVSGGVSKSELLQLDDLERRLLVCDCEGFESMLFDREVAGLLRKSDVLIEVHEHLGASLKELTESFSETHDVTIIHSLTDLERAKALNLETIDISVPDRMLLSAELRTPMTWLIALGSD